MTITRHKGFTVRRSEHHLLLVWLIFTGVILFGFIVAWNEGLISNLIAGDRSKISFAIGLLYVIGTVHCAARFIKVSRELNLADTIEGLIQRDTSSGFHLVDSRIRTNEGDVLPDSVMSRYLSDVMVSTMDRKHPIEGNSLNDSLSEVYASKIKGPHEYGWFIVDIMIKLGLLGTIVGFILMLSSVTNTPTLDVNTMQKVLKQMSSGMGTALYTTLAGLTGSVLLAVQYQILDRGADELLERTIHTAEVHLRRRLPESSKESVD